MPEESKKISFLYQRSKDHKTIVVNGAFGGLSPDQRSVIADLYLESAATPNITTSEVEGNRIKPDSEERISKSDVIRDIQTTLVMTPENAIQLGQWLMNYGKKAIDKRNKNG